MMESNQDGDTDVGGWREKEKGIKKVHKMAKNVSVQVDYQQRWEHLQQDGQIVG